MERHIVCISGGVSSAVVADIVRKKELTNTVYYFNDTLWEHADLYRFLDDIEKALSIEITRDSDGRTPEQVFKDEKMLGSNMAPLCSKILKAQRLQKYCKPGDKLYFGIHGGELKRAARISLIYDRFQCECRFPLIDGLYSKKMIEEYFDGFGIERPAMYRMGFEHNNCSGGCVRAGVRQWRLLYRTMPEVYADRMRIENEWAPHTFMKEISLDKLKQCIDQEIELPFESGSPYQGECVGICGTMS